MSGAATRACLSAQKRRLLELMQEVNFGRIEQLAVCGGEPVLDPPPRVVREIKFGSENGPRREVRARDFALKAPVRELFEHLACLGNGLVQSLEVKYGLPLLMRVEGTVSS